MDHLKCSNCGSVYFFLTRVTSDEYYTQCAKCDYSTNIEQLTDGNEKKENYF